MSHSLKSINKIVNCIEQRFTKIAIKHLCNMELFLTDQNTSSSMKEFYEDDFDIDRLVFHRNMLLDVARSKNVSFNTVEVIASFVIFHCESIKDITPKAIKLLKIILTILVSTCIAERSFSALR